MTDCSTESMLFPACRRRLVEAAFDGGEVTSDSGALLLRQADRRTGLLAAVADGLADERQRGKVRHSLLTMVRQRVMGIALGYEDLNNHGKLRHDTALQTAAERDEALASAATLCRLENRADERWAWHIHEVLVDQFIASHATAPEEVVLDFDATDDRVHGNQEGRGSFHGHYRSYCFLPLYVFADDHPLVAYLRTSGGDAAKRSAPILKLLVRRLRRAWPEVRIVMRADSGFCRPRLLNWCERNGVDYIIGLARNPRLADLTASETAQLETDFKASGEKCRRIFELRYAADSWQRERRVVARFEHTSQGANPRFVVTNMEGEARTLYEDVYCARGNMENRIKEQQLDLFADRTSCHNWWPNQLRLLMATLAYALIEAIRRLGLKGTDMARAQAATIRNRLFKIGAVVVRNTRRVRFMMSSSCPDKELFMLVVTRLKPG